MKRRIFPSKGFLTIVVVVIVIMPSVALSTSLSLISSGYVEDARFDPPDPPFTPIGPGDVPTSIAAAVEVILGTALDWLGISPVGSIYGPGISSWDNYVTFGDMSFGQTVYAQASAVGTVSSFMDPLIMDDSQCVNDTWYWGAIYELNGDLGEPPVGLHLDYRLDYTYFNLAAGGRSKAITDVGYLAYIIPAAKTGGYPDEVPNIWPFDIFEYPSDASFMDDFALHGGAQYEWVGGFKEQTKHIIGSFDLGSMNVGDRLYIAGSLRAYTECETYLPTSLDVATMFPSFIGSIVINESVPEPATMLLIGSGLIGVLGYGRKKFFKK